MSSTDCYGYKRHPKVPMHLHLQHSRPAKEAPRFCGSTTFFKTLSPFPSGYGIREMDSKVPLSAPQHVSAHSRTPLPASHVPWPVLPVLRLATLCLRFGSTSSTLSILRKKLRAEFVLLGLRSLCDSSCSISAPSSKEIVACKVSLAIFESSQYGGQTIQMNESSAFEGSHIDYACIGG